MVPCSATDSSFTVNYNNTVTDGLFAQPGYIYPSYMHTYWPVSTFVPYINYGKNHAQVLTSLSVTKTRWETSNMASGIRTDQQFKEPEGCRENVEYDYMRPEGKLTDALWGYECLGYYNSQE